jgi:hypothetical protein
VLFYLDFEDRVRERKKFKKYNLKSEKKVSYVKENRIHPHWLGV